MPTILKDGANRFFFYANENREPPHIHIQCGGSKAKFWLNPVSLASSYALSAKELNSLYKLVKQHQPYFLEKWHDFFSNPNT